MQRTTILLASASALLCGSLAAQSVPYTTAVPRVFTGTFAPGTILTPLGRSGGFIQFWWRGDNFVPAQLVTSIGVRPASGLTSPAQMLSKMEIKLADTPATYSTLSTTFANNLGANVTTVFTAKPVSLPAIAGASDPNTPVIWLVADNIYIHTGGAMIAQFDKGTSVGAVDLTHSANAYFAGASASWNGTSGVSCGGTTTASASTAAYNLQLSGADANKAGSFLIGIDHTRLGGTLPLPYKLDAFGLVGCYLGVDPIVTVGFTTDGTGGYFLSLPIPVPPTDPLILYAQALHAYAANPSTFATTNVAHSIIGGAGLSNYLYNATVDGPVAQFGPYTTDRGPVILLKP